MKNLTITLSLILMICSISLFAQENGKINNKAGKFVLSIAGLESNEGKVMIALFNSELNYLETGENFKSNVLEIKEEKCEWIIEELPFGEYAIKLYHDENGNNKMDRNMLGIPSENYGFSNNASGSFGPADYEDAKFIFNYSGQQHEINLD